MGELAYGEKFCPGPRKANATPSSVTRFLLDLLCISEPLASFVPPQVEQR